MKKKNIWSMSSCFCIDFCISLSSDNLSTGYEQLSYLKFNQNFSICVSLAKDWFILHKMFNQDFACNLNFLRKKLIHVK